MVFIPNRKFFSYAALLFLKLFSAAFHVVILQRDTKGWYSRKCSIIKRALLLVSSAEEQDEIEMSERKISHVINHKNISSILKFWKLIHVIPTILKRSCLVLSYFEQDIKKCISSSISPELHY